MNKRKWFSILALFLALSLLVTACAPAATPAPKPPSALPPSTGDRSAKSEVVPAPAEPQAYGSGQPAVSTSASDHLIIKTGNISLVVKDVQESLGTITSLASSVDGFVINSASGREGEKLVATITIKVPVAAFESTLEKLRKMAVEPPTESVNGQDVTEEYADLDAQLRNLQATERQLLNLLDKAQTVDDTLKVYQQLTNIRGQIERIQGRMSYLQKSAAMSTITVNLRPVEDQPVVKTGKEAWQPLETLKDAARTFLSFLQILGDLAIWLLVFSPIFLIPLLVLWFIWKLTRRRSKPPAK